MSITQSGPFPYDLHVITGANKTIVLDTVVWDDIRITPGSIDRPGVSDPTFQDWQPGGSGTTFKILKFNQSQYGVVTVQLPHSYKVGSDIYAHIHWTPGGRGTSEDGSTVAWKIDYSWASIDGIFGESATIDLTDTCDGVNDKHLMTPDKVISGTGKGMSSMLVVKVYRDTGDTWVGTGANGPGLLELDFHFSKDTIASRQRTAK